MAKDKLEYYFDDIGDPAGLMIRHDRQDDEIYEDEDHVIFVDFRNEIPFLGRKMVIVKDKKSLEDKKTDTLSIEEEIECFCGFKCNVIDGKVEVI